ncbi:MAG: riboflavin synthase [Rhizobiales bacterium]|nr:riboflavin synthase [Hyphomicrobiales bacterium]
MFTGIVSDIGEVLSLRTLDAGMRIRIATAYDPESIALGASMACAGPCLTVVERGVSGRQGYFDIDASTETLARTTMGMWRVGSRINLERALKLGDELGGHMVTGHIDGVAAIIDRRDEGGMSRFAVEAEPALARYLAEKGSVCLDGTSLTVNAVESSRFSVMIIPHTLQATTWGERRQGDQVNLEVDLFARYLERLRAAG